VQKRSPTPQKSKLLKFLLMTASSHHVHSHIKVRENSLLVYIFSLKDIEFSCHISASSNNYPPLYKLPFLKIIEYLPSKAWQTLINSSIRLGKQRDNKAFRDSPTWRISGRLSHAWLTRFRPPQTQLL